MAAPRGLTDEEMAALEAKDKAKRGLTDEEMAQLEAQQKPAQANEPSFLDKTGDILKGAGEKALGLGAKALQYQMNPIATAKALTDLSPQGLGGAVVHGAGKGLSAGFIDELEGVKGAWNELRRPIAELTGTADLEGLSPQPQSLADAYRRARDQRRHDDAVAQAAHPEEFAGSELGGGIVSSLAIPVTKAGPAARIAQAGGIGGAFGLGNSEEKDAGGLLKDTGTGMALGAATQGLAEGGSRFFGELGEYFRGKAAKKAVEAVGGSGASSKLKKMGYSAEDLPQLGHDLLEADLVPTGLNPFRNPLEQTRQKAEALMSRAGKNVGQVLGEFDAARPFGPLPKGIERADYIRAASDAAGPLKGITAVEEDAAGKALKLVDQINRQQELTPGSIEGLNRLKSKAYRSVNWRDEAPIAPELHRKAVSGLKESIENQVGEQMGPAALSRLKNANSDFGLGADAADLAEGALVSGPRQNVMNKLGSMGLGALGGAAMGNVSGAGLGALLVPQAWNVFSSRAPNIMATLARTGGQAADALGRAASSNVPTAAIQRLIQETQQEAQADPEFMARLKAYFSNSGN